MLIRKRQPLAKHLLGHKHGEGGADRAADHAELQPVSSEAPHFGVVASPMLDLFRLADALNEIAHDVAVRVEKTQFWHIGMIKATLPPRLAQQICWLKHGGRLRVLEGEYRRFRLGHRSDPLQTAELKPLNALCPAKPG
jgi:hypothetical protein